MYDIKYHEAAIEDASKLDRPVLLRIKKAVETKLAKNPEVFAEHLRHSLKNYWKLRIGDYRVVFEISGNEIIILGIAGRRNIYDIMERRTDK